MAPPISLLNIVHNLLGDHSKKSKKPVKQIVDLIYIKETQQVLDARILVSYRTPEPHKTLKETWNNIKQKEVEIQESYFSRNYNKQPSLLSQKFDYQYIYSSAFEPKTELSDDSIFNSQQSTIDGDSDSQEYFQRCPKFSTPSYEKPYNPELSLYVMIRKQLTSWLNRVTYHMKWKRSTFFIATHTFDAFVCKSNHQNYTPKQLSIIAIACLFIGISIEEEYIHQHRLSKFLSDIISSKGARQQIFTKQLEIVCTLKEGLLITRTPENYMYYYIANLKLSKDLFFQSIYHDLFNSYESKDGVTHLHVLFDVILILTTDLFECGEYIKLRMSKIVAICIYVYICAYVKPKLRYREKQISHEIFYMENFENALHVYKHIITVHILSKLIKTYPLLQTLLSAFLIFRSPVEQ